MGIFGKIFENKSTEKKSEFPWNQLVSEEQLDVLVKESQVELVAIFKHSTRCGISRTVLRQFEGKFNLTEEKIKFYFLDLLNHRPLSKEIASRFQVVHESPQLILLKDGEVVHQASHHEILNAPMEKLSE